MGLVKEQYKGFDLNDLPETSEVKVEFDPLQVLRSCLIDPNTDIPKPPTVLNIGGTTTLTAGNISTVIGKAKSRKTFLMTGMLSAISRGSWGDMEGRIADKNVLWFDTEQSLYHASMMLKRCHKLGAGNIKAYSLRGYNPTQIIEIIEAAVYNTEDLGFICIDGVRDLLKRGINDEEEATDITNKFLRWTTELEIHICLVLHTNKGNENARGHIGTELINKSECVFSISKSETDSSVSIVAPEFTRNREFEPFAFSIDETGLPIFTDMPEKSTRSRSVDPDKMLDQTHFDVLGEIFKRQPGYKWGKFIDQIITEYKASKQTSFGQSKARGFVTYYMNKGWIKQVGQEYQYNRAIN